jgi:delta24(24(1))-sterol reductase
MTTATRPDRDTSATIRGAGPAPAAAPTEFGGAWGAAAAMLLLPALVYYLWIAVEFHGGALPRPSSPAPAAIAEFLRSLAGRVLTHAWPTWPAVGIYGSWLAWQALLFHCAPGPTGTGALLPDGHSRLTYRYNGLFAWYVTLALVVTLHWTGLFPLSRLHAHFGSLLTVATLVATALAAACHVGARWSGRPERRTGNLVHDFFMGAVLNPRLGRFDIKFFAELRPGIMLWFFFTVAMLVRQYETRGAVTTSMALLAFYHLCYVNACYKGEECVPMSMDIARENFGWMLAWGNLVWVPFVYCLPAYYVLRAGVDIPIGWAVVLLALHLLGYWVFDTSNSQKDYFRNEGRRLRKAPPRLPWGRLEHPVALSTARGTALLVSGWWGLARHINYTGDMLMAWTWALTCGFGSLVPYAYPVSLTALLLHRERRDDRHCREKYGADWDVYRARVAHRFIPYVF